MSLRDMDTIIVSVVQKHSAEEHHWVKIDLDTWDSLSPEDRYRDIYNDILESFGFSSRFLTFTILGGLVGKFCVCYHPAFAVDLSLDELRAAHMLTTQWDARGYFSEEEMNEEEGWDEDCEYEEDAVDTVL